MSTTNQQALAEAGTYIRAPMLEKGSYVSWSSRCLRFLDYRKEEGVLMRKSIDNGPLVWKNIQNPVDESKEIDQPLSDLSPEDKERVANSYASPSYSGSSQPYYATHPPSVHDYDDDYQREVQGDAQEDKLSTAMMLLAQTITQYILIPTNNHLRTLSNTRNQAMIQDGRVDIQSKNVGYAGNGSRNAGRIAGNQGTNAGNGFTQKNAAISENVQRNPRTTTNIRKTTVQCYNCNEKGHYARDCPKPKVYNSKYFREQMLLATKYELEELNASVIMMAHIQPADNDSDVELTYDAEFVSKVNASQINLING
ncbi:retrovirus-related pol polyprotein from transposon TNT 1-94 [Tanacetum coccineum]